MIQYRNPMLRRYSRILGLCLVTWGGGREAVAVEVPPGIMGQPQATDIKTQAAVRVPASVPTMPRVRIKLKTTEYDKILLKSEQGVVRTEFRPVRNVQHTLRARIERTNHFYVGSWHIETIPLSFSKETKKYAVGLRFSKKYGVGWEMEEYVGRIEVQGTLAGADYTYDLIGSNTAKFYDMKGQPLLDVEVGLNPLNSSVANSKSPNGKGSIAKGEQTKSQ